MGKNRGVSKMKLLTLNTHSWREENQQYKLEHLAEVIKEHDYDIIALQEVNQHTDAAPRDGREGLKADNFMLKLMERLAEIGGAKYDTYWHIAKTVRFEFDEGLAVMSKYPILEGSCFPVSMSEDINDVKARRIVKVVVNYEEEPLTIYSAHMGWWHDEIEPFKYQCDRLFEEVKLHERALLIGDFNNNANIRGEGYDYLMAKGLWDTYELAKEKDHGATVQGEISGWKDNEQDLRIDLILATWPVETAYSYVIFNGDHYEVVSDHYGVACEINL